MTSQLFQTEPDQVLFDIKKKCNVVYNAKTHTNSRKKCSFANQNCLHIMWSIWLFLCNKVFLAARILLPSVLLRLDPIDKKIMNGRYNIIIWIFIL